MPNNVSVALLTGVPLKLRKRVSYCRVLFLKAKKGTTG